MSPVLPFSRAARRSVALRYDDGRPARRYHQHRAILAHGLVVEVDADDGVGSGVRARSTISLIARSLAFCNSRS
jgi:hypothetical protein